MVKGTRAEWGTCSRTVSFDIPILHLSYWNNTIAVGSGDKDIIILDATTGSYTAVLSDHTDQVSCLTFSSDGKSLVSGSDDNTVKLWDIQTGGAIKTFRGHTGWVWSVSISTEHTRISSGSDDKTIRLWEIQTGECHWIIDQEATVDHIYFSPIGPQYIISIANEEVSEWDVNGEQITPLYDGTHIAFSPDHTQFALCNGNIVAIHDSDSREIVAELDVIENNATFCCFSPDGMLVAAAAGETAYVWDVTSPNPYPAEIFAGHTNDITSLVFSSSSSLISSSQDKSIKFWKIGTLSTDPLATDPGSTPPTLSPIQSVSLQAKAGIVISSDADRVIKTWDISTGLCKATFQIPASEDTNYGEGDAKLIDGRLIFVWFKSCKVCIWDIEKGELLQRLDVLDQSGYRGIRISGDGSKIFCLLSRSIKAWSMWSWEVVGEAKLAPEGIPHLDPLCIDDPRVWIYYEDSLAQEGWDFGTPGSSPILFDSFIGRPSLDFISGNSQQGAGISWIEDIATGKELFRLSGEHANPIDVQWDGQYLVAGYASGEVFILDFHHVLGRDL